MWSGTGRVTFRVFGRPAVLHDGLDVMPGPDDHAAVLAVLVLHANTVVRDADLVAAAWGDHPPPRPDLLVPEVVAELTPRARSGGPAPSSIDRVDGGWVLRVPPDRTDLGVFTAAGDDARAAAAAGHVENAVESFRRATAASARPALHGVAGRWLAARRTDLEARALRTWVAYADLLVDRWDARAPYAAAALVERFHDLPACWERHVVALLRIGEQDAARAVLQKAFEQFPRFPENSRLDGLRALRDAADRQPPFPSTDLPASDGLPPLRMTPLPGPDVRFWLLPAVAATVDGAPVLLDDDEQAVLALLLLRHPEPTPAPLAADVVPFRNSAGGPDRQRRAETALRSLAARLTRDGLRQPVVRRTPAGWVVDVPPDAFDLARVRALAAAGQLDAVLAAVPAEPLPGLDGPWFAAVRADFVAWRWTLVALRAERLVAAGRGAEALPDLQALAARSPHDETVCAALMRSLRSAGRTADALAAYDALAAALTRDLGATPGPALQMLRAGLSGLA